ncbi:hypothetical protein [Nocardiopsis halophila]|uniref:hypothetical protein n=1 Tax=Nocardiopsis halophila TaxID=141692 RepID=UPI000349738E|nr:hypothetical protein [Nocardiopsis halophila]
MYENKNEIGRNAAGSDFGELGYQELLQDRSVAAKDSSPNDGYFCTFTLDCNC